MQMNSSREILPNHEKSVLKRVRRTPEMLRKTMKLMIGMKTTYEWISSHSSLFLQKNLQLNEIKEAA